MIKIFLSAFLFFFPLLWGGSEGGAFSQNTKQENNSPAPALMNKNTKSDSSNVKDVENNSSPALMNANKEIAPKNNPSATKTPEPKLAVSETNDNSSQPKNKEKNTNTDSKPK